MSCCFQAASFACFVAYMLAYMYPKTVLFQHPHWWYHALKVFHTKSVLGGCPGMLTRVLTMRYAHN